MECIFCRIVRGEANADFIAESEHFVAFRDIHPKAPVHMLIVPREHHATLMTMDGAQKELLGELLLFAREVAKKLSLFGYKLVLNVGRSGGQIVDHVHVHLLGGWQEQPAKVDV